MEKHSLVEEENNQIGGYTTPASKSVASVVKIDSIYIDLGIPMEKTVAGKCHHFSIRGYVADMRNKDIMICAPFPLDGNESKLREQLAPLDVTKFRWWRCQSCVQEIGAASASENLSDLQEVSPNLNGGEGYLSLRNCEKEMNSSVGHTNVSGHKNGLEDDANQQVSDLPVDPVKSLPCLIHESHTDATGSELVDICEPIPGTDEAANAVLAIEHPKCNGSSSAEISLVEKGNSLDEQQKNGKNTEIRHPSLELEEFGSDSFECDKALAGDNHHRKQHESSSDSPPEKPQKVRLMTEILRGKGNVESDQIASYNAIPYCALASSSAQRKRKVSEEHSREMYCQNNEVKTVKDSKGDLESTNATIEISDLESNKDMPLQHTGKRSRSSKMKNKMPEGEDGNTSHMSQKTVFPETSKENISLDLSLNSFVDVENRFNSFVLEKESIPCTGHWKKGERFIGESSAPDLSCGKNVPSNLNESITHRTTIQQQNSVLLHKKLDSPLQSSNKKAIESEGYSGVSRTYTDQRSDKMFEQNSCDDIPMEIVELLAKHKYERGLSEAQRSLCPSKRVDNQKNYEMVEFGEVHGNGGMRSLHKERGKWTPVNLSHANTNHSIIGRKEENPVLPKFGTPYAPNQQKLSHGSQTSAFRTFRNTDNWNGEKMVHTAPPANIQFFDTYNTSQNYSQMPPKPSIVRKLSSCKSNIETHSLRPGLHKGEVIRDLDLNLADPNAADLDMSPEYPFVSKGMGMERNPKANVMGALESFSSETIPAMQLLSLMGAGMQPCAPLSVDANKFFEKPFFPCENHPKFSMNGRPDFLEKPLFPHNHQYKEFSGLGSATYKGNGSARYTPSAYYGQEFVKSQDPEKAKIPYLPVQNKDWRSRKPVGTSGVSDKLFDSNPHQDKQKGILQNSTNYMDFAGCHTHGAIGPLKSVPKTEVCSLNRNPADFSVPDAGNGYMIWGEDLRFRKKDYYSRTKTGDVDGRKKRRVTNITVPKERLQTEKPNRVPSAGELCFKSPFALGWRTT